MALPSASEVLHVGGQAVIEGVMMRSPRSLAVACRLPDGRVVLREAPWRSVLGRLRFLRWPFLRGGVVLAESLHNGMSALSFSASVGATPPGEGVPRPGEGEAGVMGAAGAVSGATLTGTLIVGVLLALLLFGALPHLLAFLAGRLGGFDVDEGRTLAFHAVDGAFKVAIFLLYLLAISRLPEIRRVFMYHGAEHKVIHAYEAGEVLTVENARRHSPLHPRCGTAFLLLVILVGVGVFAVVFPYLPLLSPYTWVNQVGYVFLKIPLLFPIAGIAYEGIRLSGRRPHSPVVRVVTLPGLLLQRLTTAEPTDDMLEVAILSLRKVLWREAREARGEGTAGEVAEPAVEEFSSFAEALRGLEEAPPAPPSAGIAGSR